MGVPNVESSGTPLETVLNNEPESVSQDKCSEEMHVDETSSGSESEPESVSLDKCIEEEHIVETSPCSGSEPESVSDDKCPDKTHLDETHTCSNSESSLVLISEDVEDEVSSTHVPSTHVSCEFNYVSFSTSVSNGVPLDSTLGTPTETDSEEESGYT